MNENIDEQRIISELRRGENVQENHRLLFARYYPPLYYFFSRRGFRHYSHDLVQETFFRALTRLKTFRGESMFSSWLFSIASNMARNEYRKRNTESRRADIQPLDSLKEEEEEELSTTGDSPRKEWSPEDLALYKERIEILEIEIEMLPAAQRTCLLLNLKGFKYAEIAMTLNISIGTVKSHLHQARARLKDRLSRYLKSN